MHHQRIRTGKFDQLLIDLVTLQDFQALRRFAFLAHGNPNVRVQQVRSTRGFFQIIRTDDFASGAFHDSGRRLELLRRGDTQFKTQFGCRKNPLARNIARAVADKRHNLARYRPAQFLECKNVGQYLAGMLIVRPSTSRYLQLHACEDNAIEAFAQFCASDPVTF